MGKILNEDTVIQRARFLYNKVNGQEGVMVRNKNRYENNGMIRRSLWEPNLPPSVFSTPAKGSNGVQTQLNIIKSIVDTLVSKVSEAAVRPYFNAINGEYDTHQLIKQIQNYFDVWFDEQHALPKATDCFRDACLFSKGIMYIDAENQSLSRVQPWMYCIDPSEHEAGAVSEVEINYGRYTPLAKFKNSIENKKLLKDLEEDNHIIGQYDIYYDLYQGYKYELFNGNLIRDPLPLDYTQYGGLYRRPFVEMFYSRPLIGYFPPSLADDLYTIQREIDELSKRIDLATRNAIIGMILVPEGNGFKASDIENGIGIYPYQASVDGARPEILTPSPISSEFIELLNSYIERAYELAGISQISAMSKIPSNVESGKMLDSIENAESDRFNTQLQQFTHFLIDCSRVAIDCFPKDKPIISKKTDGEKLTWGDLQDKRDLYEVQFTPASVLSKNPEEKINIINSLAQQNLISKGMITDLLQIPDLESVESSISASYHYCQKIIDNAIKSEDYDYSPTVNLQMLLEEITKQLNIMLANGDNEKYITRIRKLLQKVFDDIQGLAIFNKPVQPPQNQPFEPLRDYGMDAGQIKSLMDIIQSVVSGSLPIASAIPLVTTAFPKIDQKLLGSMFQPLDNNQSNVQPNTQPNTQPNIPPNPQPIAQSNTVPQSTGQVR